MSKDKQLSNPFSTGGGGFHFEAHVQASFVALMLTGGHAPCLPCWPIVKIKLQGKISGFHTDDLIVFVENPCNKEEQRKILGQVKHSIMITRGSTQFGEVIQAAWNDFTKNPMFIKDKDIIALITGPLNKTDTRNVKFLLDQAKYTGSTDEFFRNIEQAKFSPPKSKEKLDIIEFHLKAANGGREITKDKLYEFLKHFHLLGYDLGNENGVILPLLHSHISQFQKQNQQSIWSRIVEFVQTSNQHAGTITRDQLPEDLLEYFKRKDVVGIPKDVVGIPKDLKMVQEKPKTDWAQHPDATFLVLAALVGAWNEKNQTDRNVITRILGISYEKWLNKAREILHLPDSPLSLKNGNWKVINRGELLNLLGSRILDQNLDTFKTLAISQLKERYAASIHGKVLKSSYVLRQGIAEGLAMLSAMSDACSHCSPRKVEATCSLVLHEIFSDADWILWGSLNRLLPVLAEAAPSKFLDIVEKALQLAPCPFDKLFAQEGKGIFGENHLTGLLRALESLAWDKEYLVRVCIVLGELASHDPGGQWANRPSNSLVTILLPWLPQTLAPFDKRKVAVETLLKECPEIAWNLIIQLLPSQYQTSSGSYKPSWRKTIPDNWENSVTREEYLKQVLFYAKLAIDAAGYDSNRLSTLVDHFDNLPQPAFDQLLKVLASQPILALPEEQRLSLWGHLTKFTAKHRRFSDQEWALREELVIQIEQASKQLAPTNPLNLYQYLFTDRLVNLYERNEDWESQINKLEMRRDEAISKIFEQSSIDDIIQFAESVISPYYVGYALGIIENDMIEQAFFPQFLNTANNKYKALVSGFILRRWRVKNWNWCDNLNKSDWTQVQMGHFLAYLPFTKEVWDRTSTWLQEHEDEYWTRTNANAYQVNSSDLPDAIEKLITHGRPNTAIQCLVDSLCRNNQISDIDQCIRALIAAPSSSELPHYMSRYYIVKLIKFLQADSSVDQEKLLKIEWTYLPLLDRNTGAAPKLLERKLAKDPEFFHKVIQWIYRSTNEARSSREPTEQAREIASNALQLLHKWQIPPGTQQDERFSGEHFTEWLQRVKELCMESGHLEVALSKIGEVLIHAPADPEGLWIHCAVATALNEPTDDELRRGFRIGKYNSRGVHWIDPTGQSERGLAKYFRNKAEETENAGFHRFATSLRDLAMQYDREAKHPDFP